MNRRGFWFPLLRLFSLFAALLLISCEDKSPAISSIYPRIGNMGEIMIIRGENFGTEQGESYVTVAGISPTASSYIEWHEDLIRVRIPEFGESGLIYVYREDKKSNAALFSNRGAIPQPLAGEEAGAGPRISSVEPRSGAVGTLISIQGNSFGASRDDSGVIFAWAAESSPSAPAELSGPGSIEVFDTDFGYEFWGEREIRVRVPDGAISGSLEVRTPRGTSKGEYFEVTGRPGTKTFKDKRSYALSYAVDILVQEASAANALYLWVPRPVKSASQREVEPLSRTVAPFVENYRGTTLFRLSSLQPNTHTSVRLSYLTEVYAVETSVNAAQVRADRRSPQGAAYTLPSALIPSDDPEIQRQAAAIVGREQNPYLKAQRIYQWLIREGGLQLETLSGGAREALAEKQADPYRAALLFCALARAAGVPAIPVSGVLVDRFPGTRRHFWAEFWIDGFGWIPLDPVLGAGKSPPSFTLHPDWETYYFGSLDNQRITCSRGQTLLSQMEIRGRVTQRDREYALQSLWEEAVGGLESYSSLWSDVTIDGVYLQ
jgi:transglutaminase-like putative cysteine protease